MTLYNIIRFKFDGYPRIVKRNLTLEEAQEHCRNPETSGETCSDLSKRGLWFDGYEEA